MVVTDEDTAENMIKELRGHMFFSKPLRLNFAKKDSDFNAKLKGTFDASILKDRKIKNKVFGKIREVKAQKKIIDKVLQLRNQC